MHVIKPTAVFDVVIASDLDPQGPQHDSHYLVGSKISPFRCGVSLADDPDEVASVAIWSSKMNQCHTYLSHADKTLLHLRGPFVLDLRLTPHTRSLTYSLLRRQSVPQGGFPA